MNKLINSITKKKKNDGFKSENFLSNKTFDKNKIVKLIKNSLKKDRFLSTDDRKIIDSILKSYEKLSLNKELKEKDFILRNQEILEFFRLDEADIPRYLVYRYKYNLYPKLKILDDYPPCVQIEPTSICNLRCVMCYQTDKSFSSKSKGHMGYMDMSLFKKVIDEIEGNVEAVTFASRGEPTLHPNFDEMLDYCGNKFLGLKMNTNATLLNEKKLHKIFSSGLRTLVLSIDEKNKKNYEEIRVNAKFEKIMKNLKLLNKVREQYKKSSKMTVRISGVKINDNQNVKDMNFFYKEFADEISLVQFNPWQSAYENEINNIKEVCSELYKRTFVWWDGKVNPCDYDYKSLLSKLNVNDFSIKEIWHSESYNYIRFQHANKKRAEIFPCNRCPSI